MEQITVDQLQKRLLDEKHLHVLDVREQDEFDEYNIGATLLPLSRIKNMEIDVIEDWDESDEIIIHCKSGKRSLEACMFLQSIGYTKTINLVGGILAWKEAFGDQKIR